MILPLLVILLSIIAYLLVSKKSHFDMSFDECKLTTLNDADCIGLGNPKPAYLDNFINPPGFYYEGIDDYLYAAKNGNRGIFMNPKELHNPYHPDTKIYPVNLRLPLPPEYSNDKVPYRLIPPATEFYPAYKGTIGPIL